MHQARLHHARVEPAHSPARRSRIAGIHARIVNLLFDGRPVDIQRRTGTAHFGNLQHGHAGPKLVADAQLAPVQPAGGEVLAERAGEDRISPGFQFVDRFRRDQKHCLVRAPMDLRVRAGIARQTQRSKHAGRDRPFGNATQRYVDLDDDARRGFRVMNYE